MAHRWTPDLNDAHITPEADFLNRRQIMKGVAGLGLSGIGLALGATPSIAKTSNKPNDWDEITGYNNYYEFGTGKDDPAEHAHRLTTAPWSVAIDGLVDRPASYNLEDIMRKMTVEERIYRLRCVEAWSMVVPALRTSRLPVSIWPTESSISALISRAAVALRRASAGSARRRAQPRHVPVASGAPSILRLG